MDESVSIQHILENRVALLSELNRRQAIVRDYVRGVARQYATGLYLFGRPGTSKTHTVRAVMEGEIREPYTYQRGHLTFQKWQKYVDATELNLYKCTATNMRFGNTAGQRIYSQLLLAMLLQFQAQNTLSSRLNIVIVLTESKLFDCCWSGPGLLRL